MTSSSSAQTTAEPAGRGSSLSPVKRALFTLVLLVVMTGLSIVLLEGGASLYLFARDYVTVQAPPVERPYTVHDTLLGWVNRPSTSAPNEFGAGIGLTTDARGFRAASAAAANADTTRRIICSGDAYTQGYGVADDNTWCALLGRRLGVESLNMGQAGYGVDQSYLWFERDGASIPHRLHLFAITDFALERATTSNYQGRFKPTLAIDGDRVRAANVPVPVQTTAAFRAAARPKILDDLRTLQLLSRFPAFERGTTAGPLIEQRWPVLMRALESLQASAQRDGSELVLVYLPTRRDTRPGGADKRREKLAAFAAGAHVRLIDLTMSLRALRKDSLDIAFITRVPDGAAPGVAGHYSDLGHDWVARSLASALAELPGFGAGRPPAATRPRKE